jgi:tetratricopeptide (TPR) repeat protein
VRLRLYAVVVPILLCITTCGAFADTAADFAAASALLTAGKPAEALDRVYIDLDTKRARDNAWVARLLDSISAAIAAPDATALQKLGDCYWEIKNLPKAIACFERAVDKCKMSPEQDKLIRSHLIRCHIDHNDWDKAAGEIDTAAAGSKPEVSAWWYYWLGKHYRNVWLYGRAVPHLAKAIELRRGCSAGPKLSVMERSLAECCAKVSRWDSATAETVKKLAAAYPKDSAFAHECLGIVYQGQKKYKEAIAELKPIAEPEAASGARKRLAECYRDGLQPSEAAPLIQELADRYPKDGPDLLPMVGLLYLNAKSDDRATAVFNDLAARFPDCRWQESFYSQGRDCLKNRAYARGATLLEPAVRYWVVRPKAPALEDVQRALVECYMGAKRWDDALALVTKCMTDYPNDAPYWHECTGIVYHGQGKYKEAIAELKPLADSKTAVRVRNHLGYCYRDGLSGAEAAPLVQDLVGRFPGDGVDIPSIAGILYQHLGQYDKALPDFKLICEKFPKARWQVWEACYHLSVCYKGLGKPDEGLAYIKALYADRNLPMDFAIAYGKALLRGLQRPKEAADFLAKALADHPKDRLAGGVREWLMMAYQESGQPDEVTELLKSTAASASPAEKPGILLALGDRYIAARKYREAAEVYKDVMNAPSAPPDARAQATYQLALCYDKSGLRRSASVYMLRATARYSATEWGKKAGAMLYLWGLPAGDAR